MLRDIRTRDCSDRDDSADISSELDSDGSDNVGVITTMRAYSEHNEPVDEETSQEDADTFN